MQPDKLFQMTVSKHKNLKQAGLASVLHGMRSKAPGSVKIYIAVPDHQFLVFGTVTHKGPGSNPAWPPVISQPVLVLSIPMATLASTVGHKHARADPMASAKLKLQTQAPALPGGNALIDELLALQTLTAEDLEVLEANGLSEWKGSGTSSTWKMLGAVPAANPIITVYRRKPDDLIYVVL